MERVAGIEPAQPAWKAGVLPLNYTRLTRVDRLRLRPNLCFRSMEARRTSFGLMVIRIETLPNQVVEGGGFEPPKLARQIYSLIPLATREPLLEDTPRVKIPGSPTQGRHFIGIEWLVQSFDRDFLLDSDLAFL